MIPVKITPNTEIGDKLGLGVGWRVSVNDTVIPVSKLQLSIAPDEYPVAVLEVPATMVGEVIAMGVFDVNTLMTMAQQYGLKLMKDDSE